MNYVFDQTSTSVRHAGSKARDDVNAILLDSGFTLRSFSCSYDDSPLSIAKDYLSIPRQIRRLAETLGPGDAFLLQFPFRCYSTRIGVSLCKTALKREARSIVLIHDLPCLRNVENQPRLFGALMRNDIVFLSGFDYIIAHNNRMKEYLVEQGIEPSKIVVLELFDYLLPNCDEVAPRFERKVSVAGNLTKEKTRYLYELQADPTRSYGVDLYGAGWEGETRENGMVYRGSYGPEELVAHITSGFGLVWDGDSTDECSGEYGRYLLYNNPHKMSSYIASGVPVVVWDKAAVAPFVKKHGIGITVPSLGKLNQIITEMDESAYAAMTSNVSAVRRKVASGVFLRSAVQKALSPSVSKS